jgi:hypothetical protein
VAPYFTVRLPYKKYPGKYGTVLRAICPVYIGLTAKGAVRSKKIEAIIDSGATDCIFHAQIGKAVGFDIESGTKRDTFGVDGKPTTLYFHDILLYIPGGQVTIAGAFSYDVPVAALLGMTFFEHFRITFDPTGQHCDLERIYQA